MKWYRYVIYKLYSWSLQKKSNTPIANVIFTMISTHCFQLLIFFSIYRKLFGGYNYLSGVKKYQIIIFFFVFSTLYYFLVYNKKRWQKYIEEFSHETPQQSKRGKILVLTYLIGSVLLFFLLLPIVFRK